MGSGVLDAAAASETEIMEDSDGLCKAWRHPFHLIRYKKPVSGRLQPVTRLEIWLRG
jgi:hypothetical protein